MKLNDLIEALAGEIELAGPGLEQDLAVLAGLAAEDPAFMEALDRYSGQVQRMGEATEMAGFPGLQAVCDHVLENILLLPVFSVEEREPVLLFLRQWPALMVHYLRNMDDPSTAAGLVDLLLEAPNPLDEEQGLKIMHRLGAMQEQLKLSPGGGEQIRPLLARPEDVDLHLAADTDQQVLDGFLQEAPNQVSYLVQLVRNMVSGEGDSSDIIAAKRVAHTLKGSGAIVGLRGLTSLGHHLEDILEHFERHPDARIAGPAADVLLDSAYCLEQMVGYVAGSDEYPTQAQTVLQGVLDIANLIDRGEELDTAVRRAGGSAVQDHPVPAPVAEAPVKRTQPDPGGGPASNLRVSLQLVESLFRVSGEVSVVSAALEARIKALAGQARELVDQNLRVQRRLMELENLVDVRALTMMRARTRRSADAAFDPLEMDQYSELHSTTHALAEEASDLRILSQKLEEEIAATAATQSRQQVLSRDLQHLVTGTRMTEVSVLESRLQRNVRATAQATGKEAVLEMAGGDTLIDSDVLNKLAEPLLHLLRNAVDHGLESPEERLALGKSATGRILLSFSLQGQQIHLRCSDDGRGLDYRAIAGKAVARGLIPASHSLNEDELAQLILSPGFSTREAISEVSGRGVGLDVVNEWVNGMHGTLRVSSVTGEGCTFELRFATTLSTLYALIVETRGHRFALPAIHVERALPRGTGAFEKVGEQLLYLDGDQVFVAQYLAALVGLPVDAARERDSYEVVVVRFRDRARALLVDGLVDARELLVVNPGRFGRHARGVAGLSILGDGSIAVDLDIPQLFTDVSAAAHQDKAAPESGDARQASAQRGVLVVDDALTVRNSLQQLLEDAGYRVETARDGMDAVNLLESFRPDMVLTDMEMPNMNGIEFTSYLRNQEATRAVPIIMITSRSLEKHRRLADEAGVDNYITKPYSDNDLLSLIRETIAA